MSLEFSTISSIVPDDKSTWENQIFLSFDIDWAEDFVLADCIDLLEKYDAHATWYVTHDTPLLTRLRENPKFELGIHPNFNFLLEGNGQNGKDSKEVIQRLLNLVPEATSVRSHSATASSRLYQEFKAFGMTHDSNCYVPNQAEIDLKPWVLWNDLVQVPYFWADDIAATRNQIAGAPNLLNRGGIKVFDMHPIHTYLNTEKMERYENSRAVHCVEEKLIGHRGTEVFGIRSALEQILGEK